MSSNFTKILGQGSHGWFVAHPLNNIPLVAVLFSNGVSFAGIIAFIFSDLVVFPVLRIQAQYYGWTMAVYILAVFLAVLIATPF